MKWDRLVELGSALPEVELGESYRTPALKVRGKTFVRLKEDGKSVVFITESVEEQEFLCESNADVYFITDHYKGWAAVLARLSKLTVGEAKVRLERAWRSKAPKSLLKKR